MVSSPVDIVREELSNLVFFVLSTISWSTYKHG